MSLIGNLMGSDFPVIEVVEVDDGFCLKGLCCTEFYGVLRVELFGFGALVMGLCLVVVGAVVSGWAL